MEADSGRELGEYELGERFHAFSKKQGEFGSKVRLRTGGEKGRG